MIFLNLQRLSQNWFELSVVFLIIVSVSLDIFADIYVLFRNSIKGSDKNSWKPLTALFEVTNEYCSLNSFVIDL
ncbi:CLUMA_CG007020, isoform A [Clunio marinus]|uniref:CLUMA_CG007020, isoform A n=1 Tax=Clunio marinus TaxID=568069 RepID=A0A1J1I1M3_9DIPT|nr:CLUMA_CG007020, isoform A [Clunio marinus]